MKDKNQNFEHRSTISEFTRRTIMLVAPLPLPTIL
ncbi:unnamed protein product [Prunus brigantina]